MRVDKQFALIAAIVMAAFLTLHFQNSAFSQVDNNVTDSSQEPMEMEVIEIGVTPLGLVMRLLYPVMIGAAIVVTILVWKRRLKKN